jgi:hypothetical protein
MFQKAGSVSGCTGNPCILKKGTDTSFALGFIAGEVYLDKFYV